MRDPLRIPAVLDDLRATWEALPDVSLPELWALLEARGVALNSTDDEVVDALRAVRERHPASFSFSFMSDATSPPAPILAETEGPDRRVTLVPRATAGEEDVQAADQQWWAVVRGARAAGATGAGLGAGRRSAGRRGKRGARKVTRGEHVGPALQRGAAQVSAQPGLWRVSEVKRCRSGEPLVLLDGSGVAHRLGVVRRLTVLNAEDDPRPELSTDLSGVRREELEGRVFVARLAEGGGSVVIGHVLECFVAERRELHTSTMRWSELISGREDEELVVRGLDGQQHSLGVIEALLRAE